MSSMADPMDSLVGLQQAINNGFPTMAATLNPTLRVVADKPLGVPRYTYARIEDRQVKAIAMLVLVEPIDGVLTYSIGYAVHEGFRNQGWGLEIAEQAIDEFRNGVSRHNIKQFYVEAVVSPENLASKALAAKLFQEPPRQSVEDESGEPALVYKRLVQC